MNRDKTRFGILENRTKDRSSTRKVLCSLLACMTISLSLPFSVFSDGIGTAPLSEAYLDYLNDPSGYTNGYVPSPAAIPGEASDRVNTYSVYTSSSLPSRFDLREQGRLTDVRDQGPNGDCWAFSAMGALESTLINEGYYDFSENHLVYNHGFDFGPGSGGNFSMSLAYLARNSGPVDERDDPYGFRSTNSGRLRKSLRTAYFVDKQDIKQMVYKYGGVQTGLYSPETYEMPLYFKQSTSAQFYYGNKNANHGVVIVGWDDNYPKENFAATPPSDGAWIAKNSWGKGWGETGYFYVSYYDNVIGNDNQVYVAASDPNEYKTTYQHDELGVTGYTGYSAASHVWFANAFNKKEDREMLEAVSFYTLEKNVSYEIWLVNDFSNNNFASRVRIGSGIIDYAGYHTVKLANKILLENPRFSVAVKLSSRQNYSIALERNIPGYTSNAVANPNESFMSADGVRWDDTDAMYNSNVNLKAFTTSATAASEPSFLKGAHAWESKTTTDTNKRWSITLSETAAADISPDKVAVYDAFTFEKVNTTFMINQNKLTVIPVSPYAKKDYVLYIGDISSSSGQKIKNAVKMKFTVR